MGNIIESTERPAEGPSFLDLAASLLLTFNLAITQPLLDLMGRNATYFVARDSTPLEVIAVAVGLAIIIPLALALLAQVAAWIGRGLGVAVHISLLTILVGILFLEVLKRVFGSAPGLLLIVVAAVAGVVIAVLYYSARAFRSLIRLTLPIPLLVAGLFLFGSPASKLVLPKDVELVAAATSAKPTPVVLVVFDELPVATFMNERDHFDKHLFPNFARLSRTSTWFRNAAGVARSTWMAVPAILTGQYAEDDNLPILADHPQNLFTLLGGGYEARAIEPITSLCPPQLCEHEESSRSRFSLVSDLALISAHIFIPDDLAESLPSINATWGDFAGAQNFAAEADERGSKADRRDYGDIEHFFDSIEKPAPERTVYFIHSGFPHAPWQTLPSGQVYPHSQEVPGRVGLQWNDDPWLLTQGYQRHILQSQFVDGVVGRLREELEQNDLFDRSLLIITADHGVSFETGTGSRGFNKQNFGGVGSPPLIVKRPFQQEGEIIDTPVETVDILPTIADVVGIDMPWKVDGWSLFDTLHPARTARRAGSGGAKEFPLELSDAKFDVVRRKYDMFGSVGGKLDPFAIAPEGLRDLLGESTANVPQGEPGAGKVDILNPADYDNVDLTAESLPALFEGELETPGFSSAQSRVAIGLNGKIAAITQTYGDGDSVRPFYAMLPPTMLRQGKNDLAFYVIEGDAPGDLTLHPIGASET